MQYFERKKLFLLSAFTVVLWTAPSAAKAEAPFDGLYMGLQGGYQSFDLDIRSNNLNVDHLDLSGLNGGLFVGQNASAAGFAIGLEAGFTFDGGDASISNGTQHISARALNTITVSGRAGFEIARDTLFYGRLGWARTRFSGLEMTGRTKFDGVRYGGGVDHAVTEKFMLRTEFTRTGYEAKWKNDHRYEPGQNLLTVGIGFFF